jgi:ACT domain-containing protein|tara:strand:+ start:162 stop:515 length:354 start_codon:yes stop_codon:yes gene_type:complete
MAHTKKEKLLAALEETQGLIYHACKKAGNISRSTYYRYMKEDKEFARKAEEIKQAQIDYVEGQLLKNISKGKETSIIFYLKSIAKDRGYTEKNSLDITSAGKSITDIKIEIIDTGKD